MKDVIGAACDKINEAIMLIDSNKEQAIKMLKEAKHELAEYKADQVTAEEMKNEEKELEG